MHSTIQLQLEKTEWAIKNGQSKDIVNIGKMTQDEEKKIKTTQEFQKITTQIPSKRWSETRGW